MPEPFRLIFRNTEGIEFCIEGVREGNHYQVERRSRVGSRFSWVYRPSTGDRGLWDFRPSSSDYRFPTGWSSYIQNTVNHHYRNVVQKGASRA